MRGAAEFALGRGVVACAAEAVRGPKASCNNGGYDAFLARAECTGPEHADDGFEEHTALVLGPSELLRNAVKRSAVGEVTHGVGRHVEGSVRAALGVD